MFDGENTHQSDQAEIAERRTEGENIVVDHEIITGRSPDKPDPWDVGCVRYEVASGLIKTVQLPWAGRAAPVARSPGMAPYGPMPGSNIGRNSDSPSKPGQCFRCSSMNSVAA